MKNKLKTILKAILERGVSGDIDTNINQLLTILSNSCIPAYEYAVEIIEYSPKEISNKELEEIMLGIIKSI